MKRHFSVLLLLVLLPVAPIYAQETACTSEAVTKAYDAAIAEGGDPQQWYETTYAASNCSDDIKAFAESLVTFQYHYQGQDYPIYNVPTDDGITHQWALVKKGRKTSQFIDPANPDAGVIEWAGSWRTLAQVFPPSKLPLISTPDASQAISVGIQALDNHLFNPVQLKDAVLSPDGSKIATIDNQGICLYTLSNSKNNCFNFPITFSGSPRVAYWSADNTQLAFTESYATFLEESDIWIFDTTTEQFSDVTDDDVTGDYTKATNVPFNLDYIPTWNPKTGEIIFIRSQLQTDGKTFSADLYRVSVKTGEIHQVLDLSTFTSMSPLCSISDIMVAGPSLHGVMVISSDGKTLALLMRNYCTQMITDFVSEVWLIDLDGQNKPRLLVDQTQIQSGMPNFQERLSLIPFGIAWAVDNAGLLIAGSDPRYIATPPASNAYYVDVASGNVTPILDFSKGTEAEFDGSRGTVYDVPYGFGVSPDGDKLIMISRTPYLNILSLDLPPDGSAPIRIYTNQDLPGVSQTLFSSAGAGGKFLIQGWLVTIRP